MNRISIIEKINELIENASKNRFIDSEATMDFSLEALSLSEKIDYPLGRAMSLYRLSEGYVNTGTYSKALDILFIPLDFFIKEGIFDLQLGVYILLGVIFFELGAYEKSMEFYTTAETVAKEIDTGKKYYSFSSTKSSMVIVLNNIAEIYSFLKDYTEALKYYNMAYKIDKELDFSSSRGVIILSLGQIYYLMGDYEKATIFTHKSLEYMKKYNYKLSETEAYKFLALIYWKKEDFIKAQSYFEKAMNFNEPESAPYYKIDLLIYYYEFLEYRRDSSGALKALQTAYDLSIENNLLEKTPELAALLAKFYEKLGDFHTAYKYFKMHYEYEKTFLKSLDKLRINSINMQKKIQQIENEKRNMTKKNEELLYLSENDAMTGIANRRKFDNYFHTIWSSSLSKKESISLILFDIDYFKEYNDNYGHVEGDKCIIKIADALSNFEAQPCFTSRYGGDEFIIILPNCALETALKFCDNLKNKIAKLNIVHEFSKASSIVTCSMGVTSVVPSVNITINEFISKADNALYLAKQSGRNQIASID